MKKLLKWLVGLVLFLGVLLVVAIVVLPMVFDPNDHKPKIQQIASEAVGREVVLNGPIKWSVFPWVAINLHDVTLANEAGFRGDHMAEIQEITARVKLLPLLQKQIKVGEVRLKSPHIKLQVANSGKTNWDSLVADSEPSDAADSSSDDLEIRAIGIEGGRLDYVDGSADLALVLSDLNFSSDAIKAGQASSMQLNAQLDMEASALSGDIKSNFQAENLLNDGGLKLVFDALSFQGSQKQIPLEVQAVGGGVIDQGSDRLEFQNLAVEYGSMQMNTPVTGQGLATVLDLSGDLSVAPFSLATMMEELGSELNNEASNQFSGQTKWHLQGDRLRLDNLAFKLDESTINGQFDIKQLSALQGEFELSMDQLDLDRYLPQDSASASDGAASSAVLDLGRLKGQVAIGQLRAAGLNLDNISLSINTNGEAIRVSPLKGDFYRGLINTQLQLKPQGDGGQLHVTHEMQDFQAGALLTDLMGTDYLTGLGQMEADITIAEPFSERPFKTANGRISYKLTDGDIVGIDVFQIIQQSLNFLNKTEAAASNADLKTEFGLMNIDANVTNGVLKTNTLQLKSPYFDLSGEVEIDLDQQSIRGSIKPMLTNIPEGVLDERYQKLLNIRIPVKLRGDLLAPDVSVDVEKLILASQKAKIDEKKDELKQDLIDSLLGNKKKDKSEKPDDSNPEAKKKSEKDQLKEDLLKGLLDSIDEDDSDSEDTDGGNR